MLLKRLEPPDDAESAPMLRKKPMLKKTKLSRKGSMDYQPVDTIPCIATLRPYEEEFPPLVTQTDEKKITRRPYVIPQGITPHGHQATTPQEEVLNWHTDNAVSQNKVLLWIDHTLDTLVEKTEGLSAQLGSVAQQVAELRDRLSVQAFQLDQELKAYIDNRYFGPEFQKKNRELDQVKAQLRQIEMDKNKTAVPQTLAIDSLSMYPKPFPSYSPFLFSSTYSPPETPDYDSIFKSTYHLARSISPQGQRYSSQPQPQQSQPSLQPRPHPPWKPGNFFREETSSNVSTKDKGIKEGSPAPGRSIYTLTLDNQSHSEEITEESEDETTETNEEVDEGSEENYEADLSAIAMVNPEQRSKNDETEYVFQDSDSEGNSSEEDLPPKRSIFTISSIASITTRIPKGSSIPEEELGYLGSLGVKQIDGTPRPHFDLKVKTSIYDNPIKAVALMDTGSCATVLKPHVLPKEMWAPFSKRFAAANSEKPIQKKDWPFSTPSNTLDRVSNRQSSQTNLILLATPAPYHNPNPSKSKRSYFTGRDPHTMNRVDIVGYSTMWPTDEKTVLNALAKYLCQLWQPGLYGEGDVVEGLPFQTEVPPITLQEFQSRFITSGIINQFGQYSFYALRDQPSTSAHIPNRNTEEDLNSKDPGGRVYALPPSPTRVDAGIPNDAEGSNSDPYDPYLQDAQDPNEENTEDPFAYLHDSDMDLIAVNLASKDT
ncbi:hypothetical protein Ahy_B08g091214 [Arachis hypogaea]|uniref:Polyprotein n=1 Tax=Arachis hypogaea TaxID=3818 RepID=A0A444Y1R2_ARAHY|nr:hypothetical protein Ahy_B08g091214 [Arachis hypogaea]